MRKRVIKIRTGNGALWGPTTGGMILPLLLILATGLHAQEAPPERLPFSVGVLGGTVFNAYAGELDVGADPRLGGGACGVVGGGTGFGGAFGPFAEYSLSPTFSFGLRGLFEDRSGALTQDLPASRRRTASGELETIESQYRFEMDVSTLTLEPYVVFSPLSIPLRFTAGGKIGFAGDPQYEFVEELGGDDESELSFSNGTKRQTYASGGAGSTLLFGITAGVGYDLQIARGLSLIPELTLSSYFNSPLSGESAPIIAGARPSVSLRYTFNRPVPHPDPPVLPTLDQPVPPPPPPAQPEPELVASVAAYGIGPNGERRDDLLVVVDERIRRREIALLPYIFFPESSAEIPPRYTAGKGDAGETIVGRYRSLLDLLGERMRARPAEKITLIGTNADAAEEKGNLELSRKRAANVAVYLTGRWGIDPSRMTVEGRNLPERPSNPTLPGGREENRRVEIVADGSLLDPMIVEDTIRTYSSPGFGIETRVPDSVAPDAWEMRMAVGGRTIRSMKGEGIPEGNMVQPLTKEEAALLASGADLTYSLSLQKKDADGFSTGPQVLAAQVERIRREDILLDDRSVTVSTPILFPYNSAELSREDREVLEHFKASLPEGAKLTITGYADDLGESGYNRTLSGRRAEAVAKLFSDLPVTVVAAGEEGAIGGENTPEGRFYARTVMIEVER